jgi:predicted nucleic acid-binding protein
MMIVDTNVIIEFWRNPSELYKNVFQEQELAICGIVIAELIHGAKSNKEVSMITHALEIFHLVTIEDEDWIEVGKMLNTIRKNGLNIPFQDVVISYLAIKKNMPVWTNDKHFEKISRIIPDLEIFIL